jgi:hypothetical protein
MIESIHYLGPLITDTSIPGEGKGDEIVPGQGNAIPLSKNRWGVFFATLDPGGWDAVRSVIYQIRADAPNGPLVKEGLIEPYRSGWDPLNEGISLRKSHGSTLAFEVPSPQNSQKKIVRSCNVS